jgi:hypothetical protein
LGWVEIAFDVIAADVGRVSVGVSNYICSLWFVITTDDNVDYFAGVTDDGTVLTHTAYRITTTPALPLPPLPVVPRVVCPHPPPPEPNEVAALALLA